MQDVGRLKTMFKWLTKQFAPKKLNDPVLGSLLYMGGYWEGEGYFPATGNQIEWFVDANENGPGEPQRQLLHEINKRYSELETVAFEAMLEHIVEWVKPKPTPSLSEVLKLTAISIPSTETPDMKWTLMYESSLRGEPCFDVEMIEWKPSGNVEVST